MKQRHRQAQEEKSPKGVSQEVQRAQEAAGRLASMIHEAHDLVERSEFRDHLYEVAGHLIEDIPRAVRVIQESLGKISVGVKKASYRRPVEELSGYQTYVRRDEDTSEGTSDRDRTKERALPQPRERTLPNTEQRTRSQEERRPLPTNDPSGDNVPQAYFNVPPAGEPGSDMSKTRTRRRTQPGEQYGTPYKETPLLTRRTMEGMWRRAIRKACMEVYG